MNVTVGTTLNASDTLCLSETSKSGTVFNLAEIATGNSGRRLPEQGRGLYDDRGHVDLGRCGTPVGSRRTVPGGLSSPSAR